MRFCKLIVFSLFIVNCSTNIAISRTLTIGWQLWYPYQYYDGKGITGTDVKIAREVFSKINHPVKFVEIPWIRHLNYLENGKVDIALGATKNKAREQYSLFSIPYRHEQINVFYLTKNRGKFSVVTVEDIKNSTLNIAIEKGYDYGKNVKDIIENTNFKGKILHTQSLELSVNLLLDGEVDLFFADGVGMKAFQKKYNIDKEIYKSPLILQETTIHMMLSKSSKNVIDINEINNAIKELCKAGRIQYIINNQSTN